MNSLALLRKALNLFCLLTPAVFGANVTGDLSLFVKFNDAPNVVLTPMGAPGSSLSTGLPSGPDFVQTELSAVGRVYGTDPNDSLGFYATAHMNLTAGPGTSFQNAIAESTSGLVRLANTGLSTATVTYSEFDVWSTQAFGPGQAFLTAALFLEKWNAGTSNWDPVNGNGFSVIAGEANSFCTPQCAVNSAVFLAAGEVADFRVRARLQGTADQDAGSTATPEPGTALLLASGLLLLVRKR